MTEALRVTVNEVYQNWLAYRMNWTRLII